MPEEKGTEPLSFQRAIAIAGQLDIDDYNAMHDLLAAVGNIVNLMMKEGYSLRIKKIESPNLVTFEIGELMIRR
jgi:hypothetical protein